MPHAMSSSPREARSEPRVVLDPTSERQLAARPRLPRLARLEGATVALLDIAKPRGDRFLDCLQQRFERAGAAVVRFRKPTFTKPAPVDLRQQIAVQCGAVVEALAD